MSTQAHESFNQAIKDLFKLFKDLPSQKFKSKLHIGELQTKMVRGIHTEPLYAITILGPLVWRTRDEITNRNAEFFLQRRYEMDVQKMCVQHKVNYDNAINTVGFMKDAFVGATKDVQDKIFELLLELVKYYAQYVQTQQQTK